MKIDKQIKQWAQMVLNESKYDEKEIKSFNSPHSKVFQREYNYTTRIKPDVEHGYYATIQDFMNAVSVRNEYMKRNHYGNAETIVAIEYMEGTKNGLIGDIVTKYVSDIKYKKGLFILDYDDDIRHGMTAEQILKKIPNDFDPEAEIVTKSGHRFYTVEKVRNEVVLITDFEYAQDVRKNPRVKNGEVNEEKVDRFPADREADSAFKTSCKESAQQIVEGINGLLGLYSTPTFSSQAEELQQAVETLIQVKDIADSLVELSR